MLIEISSRGCRWVRRFRKRCGYGIHSPFVFNLVTGVIYEKWQYYAYSELHSLRTSQNAFLREKDDRLLFRLVNQHQPSNGIVIGDDIGITERYMKSGCTHAKWINLSLDNLNQLPHIMFSLGKVDFIYVDVCSDLSSLIDQILPFTHDHSLLVIRNIHDSKENSSVWQNLILDPHSRVSLDLYDFGLVYFEERLNKEDFIINYF